MDTARVEILLADLQDARRQLEALPRGGLRKGRILLTLFVGCVVYGAAIALDLGAFWEGAALSAVVLPVVELLGHRLGPPLALHDLRRESELRALISTIEDELRAHEGGPAASPRTLRRHP